MSALRECIDYSARCVARYTLLLAFVRILLLWSIDGWKPIEVKFANNTIMEKAIIQFVHDVSSKSFHVFANGLIVFQIIASILLMKGISKKVPDLYCVFYVYLAVDFIFALFCFIRWVYPIAASIFPELYVVDAPNQFQFLGVLFFISLLVIDSIAIFAYYDVLARTVASSEAYLEEVLPIAEVTPKQEKVQNA